MYFEEWIIAFSGVLIIHTVLLLVIITVCTYSLYWYLTVLPFPARPYYLVAKQESLFGVANYAGLFCAKLFSVKIFLKLCFKFTFRLFLFKYNKSYCHICQIGCKFTQGVLFLPFSCCCNSTQVTSFACLDIKTSSFSSILRRITTVLQI